MDITWRNVWNSNAAASNRKLSIHNSLLNSGSAVFEGMANIALSLWWKSVGMGRSWMVPKRYSYKRPQAGQVVCMLVLEVSNSWLAGSYIWLGVWTLNQFWSGSSVPVVGISDLEGCGRWFAKRFLHPDLVEPYEYIFIWDEDLDLRHFNAER